MPLLCPNREGWGPISALRLDFTPCFIDGAVLNATSLFIILLGSFQIYFLSRRSVLPIEKDWHYFAKISLAAGLVAESVVLVVCRIVESRRPGQDVLVASAVLQTVSFSIALAIHHLEHARTRVANGVVLFYWLGIAIFNVIKLRSEIILEAHQTNVVYFVVYTISVGFAAILFILEAFVPKAQSDYEMLTAEERCPVEDANVFSRLAFSWMSPTMRFGYHNYLTEADLGALREKDSSTQANASFHYFWQKELKKKSPSLWWAITRAFGSTYAMAAVFKGAQDILAFVQPQLLRLLISFVTSYATDQPDPPIVGASIAAGMFLVSVLQTIALHQYFQRGFDTGMRLKAGVVAAVYKKALVLSNEGRSQKSTGDIVNLMSVDTQRLQDLMPYGQTLWSGPFQIILCLASLYQLVGYSMFAGVAVMVLMIPLNAMIARLMKRLQEVQMKNKDQRTRLMNEILSNIKSIKLYAWEPSFMQKLNHVRNDKELQTLRTMGIYQSAANFSWGVAPFFVSCSTFGLFVIMSGQTLTTDIVFPALALFNLLTFPLAVIPNVITSIVEAGVAVRRLTDYLQADELQPDAVDVQPAVNRIGQSAVIVEEASFTWGGTSGVEVLRNIDFTARKGELSCIVGRVACGKSSFLQAILGDLHKTKGTVITRGNLAYVAQLPWIMNASVKENILFGHRFDEGFYHRTINACGLKDDFAILPDGDETEVGEKGISLSGGQKARLSLARAVYSRADIFLLDDILSAVDQHVGRHIIDNVLSDKGLLATKTRILASNAINVLSVADSITLLQNGEFVESGSYEEVMESNSELAKLIREFGKSSQKSSEDDSNSDTMVETDVLTCGQSDDDVQKVDRRYSTLTVRRASVASFHRPRGKIIDEEHGPQAKRTIQAKEFAERGKVSWDVYKEYAKACNLNAVWFYLLFLIGGQASQVAGNYWLKYWSEENTKAGTNPNFGKFIGIYFAFGVTTSTMVACFTLILYLLCTIQSAKSLHARMAKAIFRSPMQFFETTPLGRILNRFSNDIYRIDEVLGRTFNMFFTNCARVIFTVGIITATTPIFVVIVLPLSILYLYVQRYYLRTSRELRRLDSTTRSPVYSHFQESLAGVATIRAYRQQKRFSQENEWRLDLNLRAYFPSICANRWLAVRLEFIGSVIILTAAMLAIVTVVTTGNISAGMVGLSMSYALQITQALNWIVRQTVEVETNIVSVERVLEYSRLPSEAPEVITNRRPAASWPAKGEVHFQNYATRYREGLDLVLKGITLDIKPREKIGIVGRTGAGKSSLTMALFRIIEAAQGNIKIDDVDTSSIGLHDLRKRIAIIPQDSQVFEGTFRENLDPADVHDDTDLWQVLELAHLKDFVRTAEGGLLAKVNEGGSNMSAGQRQLMCLARALLTASKILVLDEATAAVDVETDQLLQKTIREEFKDRTILTIAHRINSIMDSDRIVVLSAGKVAEFDTPANLLARPDSMFASLVNESGLGEQKW